MKPNAVGSEIAAAINEVSEFGFAPSCIEVDVDVMQEEGVAELAVFIANQDVARVIREVLERRYGMTEEPDE